MDIKKRNELLPTLARLTPALIPISLFVHHLMEPFNNKITYINIMFFILKIINWSSKTLIARPIYNLIGKDTLPILGIGRRPLGAISCGELLDGKPSKSYGMPSGHSQIVWALTTYLLYKTILRIKNLTYENKTHDIILCIWLVLSCILILCFGIYVSYSRVYIEGCHTLQQVIVGGVIGCVCGFLIYYFEDYFVSLLNKYQTKIV